MAKTIRQLNVVVDVNASRFERGMAALQIGLDRAEREWKAKFGRMAGITDAFANKLLAVGAATVGFGVKAAVDLGNLAEQLDNMRQSTGLSTDQLQVLKFAAENAGKSFEVVANASAMVQQKLMNADSETENMARALKMLGIEVKDSTGHLRPMSELFPQIVTRLQGMRNTTERNMIAAQLFGRSWKEFAPILGMTAREFAAAEAEARKMGLVLSGETLASARDLDERLDKLNNRLKAFWLRLGEAATPLVEFGTKMAAALDKVNPKVLLWGGLLAGVLGAGIKLYNWGTKMQFMLAGIRTAHLLAAGAAGTQAGVNMTLAGSFLNVAKGAGLAAARIAGLLGLLVILPSGIRDIGSGIKAIATGGKNLDTSMIYDEKGNKKPFSWANYWKFLKKNTWTFGLIDKAFGGGGEKEMELPGLNTNEFIPDMSGAETADAADRAKYSLAQKTIRQRVQLEADTTGRLEQQNRLIVDYYAAADAGEKQRLAAEIARNQLTHQQEIDLLNLAFRRYREVYAAVDEAAIDAINDKYDLEEIRLQSAQQAALEALNYKNRKEEEIAQKLLELDKARYEAQKSHILEVANSYLQYNRDYVRGIEAGLQRAEALRAGGEVVVESAAAGARMIAPLTVRATRGGNLPFPGQAVNITVKPSKMFEVEVERHVDNYLRREAARAPGG